MLYLSEVQVRNDIATTMKERASPSPQSPQRKTRYRPARWLNRKNSIKPGRFSPTMRSKIEAHLREIRFVQSLLPITSIVLETGTFDPHALKNPEVLAKEVAVPERHQLRLCQYQSLCAHARWLHLPALSRENRKINGFEVHHIIFRSQNGSDEETNLLTLCKTCHDGLHAGTITLKRTGKKKGTLPMPRR